jgi:hypothetical protein
LGVEFPVVEEVGVAAASKSADVGGRDLATPSPACAAGVADDEVPEDETQGVVGVGGHHSRRKVLVDTIREGLVIDELLESAGTLQRAKPHVFDTIAAQIEKIAQRTALRGEMERT